MLPFTPQQFFDLFRSYNEAVWPAPVALTGVALFAAACSFARPVWAHRAVYLALAVIWLWTGLVYQLAFFSRINPAARIFALLWVLGAFLFLRRGALRGVNSPSPSATVRIAGAIFIVYALVVYPLLGRLSGHAYPAAPTFGAPCPVTIVTLGILLWEDAGIPLFVAPLLWSAIGSSAAWLLGMCADLGMLAAALVSAILLVNRRMRAPGPA